MASACQNTKTNIYINLSCPRQKDSGGNEKISLPSL